MAANVHRDGSARWLAVAACCALAVGCGTTRSSNTARTATEQLLLSDAIDRTVQQVDLNVLAGQTVFFDERYLLETVDKGYLISSFRQHLLASGCILKEKREDAEFVVEPRVGAVGTDNHDLLFGVPAIQVPQVALAPTLPAAIPEIPLAKKRDQRGIAKLAVFAFRRETGEPVWQSGIVSASSQANDIWVFGAGPFQRGTIYDRTVFAGGKVPAKDDENEIKQIVGIDEETVFAGAPAKAPKGDVAPAGGVMQASAELPVEAGGNGAPPVLPPPRPIAEAPPPEDPAVTAG